MLVSKYHWGTFIWAFLHTITICDKRNISNEDIECTKKILVDIKNIIPCSECKNEYTKHLKDLEKISLNDIKKDKMLFFKWTVQFHNFVNRKLNKTEISYSKAIDIWTKNE